LNAEVPIWGFASHPLVDGDLLYTMVGGEGQGVVAFDKRTGEIRWKALDAKAGYCPLSIIQAGQARQLIAFHPEAVVSLNPENGKQNWSIPMQPSYEMSIARPMIEGNRMYASSIHNEAVLIELADDQAKAKEIWRGEPKSAVHCANATPILMGGVIYGTDCVEGCLIAVDGKSGSRLWKTFEATQPSEERFVKHGTAFLTRLGDSNRFLVMSETGDLQIAELSEQGYSSRGRFHALEPTAECFGRSVVWSHPAYANQTAYIRNDKEIVAVDLAR
jgi:outer membrane protein assembly factor BamB